MLDVLQVYRTARWTETEKELLLEGLRQNLNEYDWFVKAANVIKTKTSAQVGVKTVKLMLKSDKKLTSVEA